MYSVNDLVEAVLAEPKDAEKTASVVPVQAGESGWEKLAGQLEEAAQRLEEESQQAESGKTDVFRMKKLAMAVILDTMDDPKMKPMMDKLGQEVLEKTKTAFQSPEPGSVGDLAQMTNSDASSFVKEKVGSNRTLFHRLKTNAESAPNSEEKK